MADLICSAQKWVMPMDFFTNKGYLYFHKLGAKEDRWYILFIGLFFSIYLFTALSSNNMDHTNTCTWVCDIAWRYVFLNMNNI